MHDVKNRPLRVGDRVLIPAVITGLMTTEEYCNVTLQTTYGRRPDDAKEYLGGINTGVLVRNEPGDDNADLLF